MKKILFTLCFILIRQMIFAQSNSTKSLINETMLHPADAFTGYVYKKGEWGYNQALTPYPSWAWWGITDKITTELDLEAWFGGVPSFNFRISILKQKEIIPHLAFETMFQYLKNTFDQFQNLDYLQINRRGINWYNHINTSWKIGNKWHIHLSGGITYAENLQISNNDTLNYTGKSFSNLISSDYSLALGWRFKRGISFHSSFSSGSTFLYADNIAKKQQFVLATRIAPFIKSEKVFFYSFRFELAYLYANFPDAQQNISGPIGFLYWKWNWNKNDIKSEVK